jgi:hypothetical protein
MTIARSGLRVSMVSVLPSESAADPSSGVLAGNIPARSRKASAGAMMSDAKLGSKPKVDTVPRD